MNHDYLLEQGTRFLENNEYVKALNCYDIVTNSDPYNTEAFYLRGLLNFKLGRYKGALHDLNKAIETGMSLANIFFFRAMAYRRLNMPEISIRDFNKAISLSENHADAFCNRGLAYYSILNDDRAIDDFTKALSLRKDPKVFFYRGLAYARKGLPDKAVADFSDEYLANLEHNTQRPEEE
ncbi:MAG: tetratricopeptide repeat protein [Elusimicrobiaceae bacterium]